VTISDYEVVKYDPSLLDDVLRLEIHLWGDNAEINRRYFEWKYEQNPYVQEPLIYVVLHRGTPVAVRGMHGALWEVGPGGERSTMLCAGDTVVAPAHRGRGLFRLVTNAALSDLRQQGHEYVLNFGAGQTARLLSLRSGWERISPYRIMARHTSPFRHPVVTKVLRRPWVLRLRRTRAALAGLRKRNGNSREEWSPFRAFDSTAEQGGQKALQCLSFAKDPRPEDMAGLAARRSTSHRIRHVRGPEYFGWRFRNPLSRYRFVYWDDGRLEGYLVLEVYSATPAKTVHLVDWEYSDEETAYHMLRAAIRVGEFPVIESWSISLDEKTRDVLHRCGFRDVEEPDTKLHPAAGPLITTVSKPQPTSEWSLGGLDLLDTENWELRMIYSDEY
jgi:GNAT superfamily N-acetyltransferase